jgi:hypothetical protein
LKHRFQKHTFFAQVKKLNTNRNSFRFQPELHEHDFSVSLSLDIPLPGCPGLFLVLTNSYTTDKSDMLRG